MNCLISIIVPIYNAESTLDRCIQSILSQSHSNIELILVNDGSKDRSLEICKKYERMDSRVSLINKENTGVSDSRNLAIKSAVGDFIGFVDSDDFIHSEMYTTMISQILRDRSQICTLANYTIKPNSLFKERRSSFNKETALTSLFLMQFPTSVWAYLYEAKLLKDNLFDKNIHFFEDFEINYRIINSCDKVSLCYEQLYYYEISDGSINRAKLNKKRMSCLKIYDTIDEDIQKKFPSLIFSRSHFIVSMIHPLASYGVDDKLLIVKLKKEARKILFSLLKSSEVPIKYKVAIVIASFNPVMFSVVGSITGKSK
ncbi:glycosyltransferase family 2 protein [Enterococcus sp. CWB-B31]|uniref:glycosyltransferase family 2 protein n=1 Tax=Enterococcus sp. CWB-B31 TaxID=2885159 RepID=UPI001E3754E6|nr:glycosyltransferase [Enterococcus sp. CWB-B31]MCB5954626.1 glycosyltransferase [Enterococcus sp. CWB-B31]